MIYRTTQNSYTTVTGQLKLFSSHYLYLIPFFSSNKMHPNIFLIN